MDSQDKRRGRFFTPEQDLLNTRTIGSLHPYAAKQERIVERLSLLTYQIAISPLPGGYTSTRMSLACADALKERNLFNANVTDCVLKASRDYASHFSEVAHIPDLACVLGERSTRLLWSLLSNTQHPDHPLEFVLMIDWLFGNWTTFLSQYEKPTSV